MFDIPEKTNDTEVTIHPTAIVEKGAQLGKGVKIGPYAFVGSQVRLGDFVKVDMGAIIENDTSIDECTVVYPYATVGCTPQDLKYAGEPTNLIIGKRNSIRQYCNISVGTAGGGNTTKIGDDNLFMIRTHVGHDCTVGNHCILANGVTIAGHVTVLDHAILGGHSAVHQFTSIGALSMAAGGAIITQDVPPFCMVHGNRASVNGLNVVGLKRSGIKADDFQSIKKMYKIVFRTNMTLEDALANIDKDIPDSHYKTAWLSFIKESKRGICR